MFATSMTKANVTRITHNTRQCKMTRSSNDRRTTTNTDESNRDAVARMKHDTTPTHQRLLEHVCSMHEHLATKQEQAAVA
jgi:hypothetical protein